MLRFQQCDLFFAEHLADGDDGSEVGIVGNHGWLDRGDRFLPCLVAQVGVECQRLWQVEREIIEDQLSQCLGLFVGEEIAKLSQQRCAKRVV